MNATSKSVGVFVGGGPAPGINAVIAAATIEARNRGWRVVGILDGLRWLAEGITTQVRDLRIRDVSRVHLTGGSMLRISRGGNVRAPEIRKRILDGFRQLGLDALISIGGDGTATAASVLADHAPWLRVIHVPKTIDNDLPLPGGFSTFGFQTARHHGVEIISSLMEDAKTTGRWYFVITMGRDAGHLALGIAKSSGATMSLLPEEFERGTSIEDMALPIEASMMRRLAEGRRDGVVVLAEGLARKLDPKAIPHYADIERTQKGELRLTDLPLGNLLREHLERTFSLRGVNLRMTTKVIGYELRCAAPIPFDSDYCRDLGFGAMRAVLRSPHNGIVCREGDSMRVCSFSDMQDPNTGRMRIRLVDTDTESYKVALRYQLRMRQSDLEDPQKRAKIVLASGLNEADVVSRYGPVAMRRGHMDIEGEADSGW